MANMGIFEQFPYTNLHDLNLDYVLKKVKELEDKIDDELNLYIREQLDGLFVNSSYDEETETLTLVIGRPEA